MPMDFPSSPTVGQQYNGYVWTGTAWDSTSAQPISLSTTAPGYNYIINGGMDIAQRGTSFTSITNLGYPVDRWQVNNQGVGTIDTAQIDVSSAGIGVSKAVRITRTSGSASTGFMTVLEDALSQVGKTLTLSFYVRKGAGFPSNLEVNISTRTTKFGTVYDQGALSITNAQINTSTFTRFSVPITVTTATSTAGANLFEIEFNLSGTYATGSTAFFEITGVQLEQGTTVTAFRRNAPSIAGELAACQRYYWRSSTTDTYGFLGMTGICTSTTSSAYLVRFPVTMRTKPALVEYSNLGSDDGTTGRAISSATMLQVSSGDVGQLVCITSSAAQTVGRPIQLSSNAANAAFIGFSAEL